MGVFLSSGESLNTDLASPNLRNAAQQMLCDSTLSIRSSKSSELLLVGGWITVVFRSLNVERLFSTFLGWGSMIVISGLGVTAFEISAMMDVSVGGIE